MSGGGRRGELRARDAGPERKVQPGTHNRKARRAGKATCKATAEPLFDRARDEADSTRVAERFRRMRENRAAYWASKTPDDVQAMALEQSERDAEGFDEWFIPLLFDAVPKWARRHWGTDPDVRVRRAHELAEVIAYSQGSAAISDPDARGTEKKGGVAEVFNAIAEGLGIGAFSPGGATFAGVNWLAADAKLQVTNRELCVSLPLGPT